MAERRLFAQPLIVPGTGWYSADVSPSTSHGGLTGLEVVEGDELVVVVRARSTRSGRELGPTAWSLLETLVLTAHPNLVGGLVASANAQELAATVGVGRDAATTALPRL